MSDITPRSEWVWMGHAGHFICGRDCGFRLNTYVNGYIVSTVGELKYSGDRDGSPFQEVGFQRLYETMVFKAMPTADSVTCCPYEQESGQEIDFRGYNEAGDAYAGHMEFCEKYAGWVNP